MYVFEWNNKNNLFKRIDIDNFIYAIPEELRGKSHFVYYTNNGAFMWEVIGSKITMHINGKLMYLIYNAFAPKEVGFEDVSVTDSKENLRMLYLTLFVI